MSMKRILTVEDDETLNAWYRALFSAAGYSVATAGDVTGGVLQFREFRPHVVILDVDIPGGWVKFFELVRVLPRGRVPVVFVTAFPERVERLRLVCRSVRLFGKPVNAEALLDCVRRLAGP